MKLKVLQISHDYEGPFQQVCRQYCEGFGECDVTTVYLRGFRSDAVSRATGGDRVVYFEQPEGSLRGIKFNSIFRLASMFRKHSYDVVIAHRYKAIYIAGMMSFFFPIKVLLGVAHEHKVFKRKTRSLFVTFWRKNIELVAVSKSVKEDILQYCPSLEPQGRIHVLGNAIDPEGSLLTRKESRERMGIPPERFCFGTVGRLVDKKEHDQLLRAYAKVQSEHNHLVIVGDGYRKDHMQKLARQLGVQEQVTFTGYVPDARKMFTGFDTFVFTSGRNEAFGIVLLEAMRAGVAVISSDAPGPSEVIGDAGLCYKSGEVTSLSDAMQMIENLSEVQRIDMAKAGFQRMKSNYSIGAFVQKLKSIPAVSKVCYE